MKLLPDEKDLADKHVPDDKYNLRKRTVKISAVMDKQAGYREKQENTTGEDSRLAGAPHPKTTGKIDADEGAKPPVVASGRCPNAYASEHASETPKRRTLLFSGISWDFDGSRQ